MPKNASPLIRLVPSAAITEHAALVALMSAGDAAALMRQHLARSQARLCLASPLGPDRSG